MVTLNYRSMKWIDLIRAVVDRSDPLALEEILSRPLRTAYSGPTIPEFLDGLRCKRGTLRRCGWDSVKVELAYDLAIDKFSNLPRSGREPPASSNKSAVRRGLDCRCYYRPVLKAVTARLAGADTDGIAKVEELTVRLLIGMLLRHFDLACLEVTRRPMGPDRSYRWKGG